jgi:hypothetical protein
MKNIAKFIAIVACVLGLVACGAKAVESADELIALGAQYLLDGNYEEAVVTFDKAIAIDDKNIVAYMGLGDGNLGMEDYDKAGAAYDKAIGLDSEYVEGYIGCADTYLFAGDQAAALDILAEGYSATSDESLNTVIDEINAGTYEPTILHIDWAEIADNEPKQEQTKGDEKVGARTEKIKCDCDEISGEHYELVEYNSLNQNVKIKHCDGEGNMNRYVIFKYDNSGRFVHFANYTANGECYEEGDYNYNNNGEVSEINDYSLIETDLWWTILPTNYQFSFAEGARDNFYADGALSQVDYLDKDGEVYKTEYYNPDGTLTDTETY